MNPADLIQELRNGLEGVTPGPWDVMTCNTVRAIDGYVAIPIFDARVPWKKHRHTSTAVKQEWHNARHVARCSPDNIRTLLDTLAANVKALAEAKRLSDRWEEGFKHIEKLCVEWKARADDTASELQVVNERRVAAESEIAEIRAESERLRKALATADEAIAEYIRYLDGGQMRGSYDGKPERDALRKAGYVVRAASRSLGLLDGAAPDDIPEGR